MRPSPPRFLAAVAAVALSTVLLSGCTLITTLAQGGSASPTPTASETSTSGGGTTTSSTPTSTPTTEAGTRINFFDLKVGDCFDIPADSKGQATLFSSCEPLHVYEAYAIVTMTTGGATYPGDDAVNTFGNTACADAFAGYVGTSTSSSKFDFQYITPSKETWEGQNDRELMCILVMPDKTPVAGSAHNSRK